MKTNSLLGNFWFCFPSYVLHLLKGAFKRKRGYSGSLQALQAQRTGVLPHLSFLSSSLTAHFKTPWKFAVPFTPNLSIYFISAVISSSLFQLVEFLVMFPRNENPSKAQEQSEASGERLG